MSAFARQDGYHTYSAYARGLDGLWGMYQWLDRAPLGRNENGMWWSATTSTTPRSSAAAHPVLPRRLSPSAVTLLAVILLKREAGSNVDSCIQRDVRNCPP